MPGVNTGSRSAQARTAAQPRPRHPRRASTQRPTNPSVLQLETPHPPHGGWIMRVYSTSTEKATFGVRCSIRAHSPGGTDTHRYIGAAFHDLTVFFEGLRRFWSNPSSSLSRATARSPSSMGTSLSTRTRAARPLATPALAGPSSSAARSRSIPPLAREAPPRCGSRKFLLFGASAWGRSHVTAPYVCLTPSQLQGPPEGQPLRLTTE